MDFANINLSVKLCDSLCYKFSYNMKDEEGDTSDFSFRRRGVAWMIFYLVI